MSQPTTQIAPPPTDPHKVQEVYLNGPMNVSFLGALAQLTMCHTRPVATDLFAGKQNPALETVVMARLVMPSEQLLELRNLLNRMVSDAPAGAAKN